MNERIALQFLPILKLQTSLIIAGTQYLTTDTHLLIRTKKILSVPSGRRVCCLGFPNSITNYTNKFASPSQTQQLTSKFKLCYHTETFVMYSQRLVLVGIDPEATGLA
jgi:hypothetical protein